jgi:nicotinic acid phosphoribosyltransferase
MVEYILKKKKLKKVIKKDNKKYKNVKKTNISKNKIEKKKSINIESLMFSSQNSNKNNNKLQDELNIWFEKNKNIIEKDVLSKFDNNGISNTPLSATTYNDFYKFSMLPVIFSIEKCKKYKDKPIYVTFSVNIRDPDYRTEVLKPELIKKIVKALESLKERFFSIETFNKMKTQFNLNISDEDITSVCGPKGNPRGLIQEVITNNNPSINNREKNRKNKIYIPKKTEYKDDVVINVFKMKDIDEEERLFIEATGPWHKVTWLETSMMQCVYEVLLRDKLSKEGTSYQDWLQGALLRCMKSIDGVNNANKNLPNGRIEPIKGALFTGRRTGGYLFMMLQNMLVADKLENYIGTSSVDAYLDLKGKFNKSNFLPAGTHAHELSMVCSTLFGKEDNESGLPLSQLLGHYLYYLKSRKQKKNSSLDKIPMLPDTLGTDAFLYAANKIKIPKQKCNNSNNSLTTFIKIISSARQDSGTLLGFIRLLRCHNFKGNAMASEIENLKDIKTALKIKRSDGSYPYTLFGAGGFFGDSVKAHDPLQKNISMAVKAVRVFETKNNKSIEESNYYPIKTGNSNSTSKKEINRTLNKNKANKKFSNALEIKDLQKVNVKEGQKKFDELIDFF